MNLEEKKMVNNTTFQNLVLENREKLSISGVIDVLSFDDQVVIIETELGLLTVKGENLKIHLYLYTNNKITIHIFFMKISSLNYYYINKVVFLKLKNRYKIIILS